MSGVVTWALRLSGALAALGHRVGLVVHHRALLGAEALARGLPSPVRLFDAGGLPPLDRPDLDLGPHIAFYREAVAQLRADAAGPVVAIPNLSGHCYGVFAALALVAPEAIRVLGWQHNDTEYDYHVTAHYEPLLARMVAVSRRIRCELGRMLPARRRDIMALPYGVPCAPAWPARPLRAGRPLRLVYTGRIEHRQKRILALPALSVELAARGIAHEIVVRGAGPAATEFDEACANLPVRRRPPVPFVRLVRDLDRADAFVLPSRYEGLSVAMLEAMGRGCAPIVTDVASGAREAIQSGENGMLAAADEVCDEVETARALADAIEAAQEIGFDRLGRAAWATVRERFDEAKHAAQTSRLVADAAARPARSWSASRPCAFVGTGADGATHAAAATVPYDAAARMRTALERLSGRRVVIHGAGAHTVALAPVLAEAPCEIVAIADDDRARQGARLWNWPVIDPAAARAMDATDVVISSWLHERAIWRRRAAYERQGLHVHALYREEQLVKRREGR